MKATIEYKKGEVYLCARTVGGVVSSFFEVEIIEVSQEARAVKIKETDFDYKWEDISEFHKTVKAKLGYYKIENRWFWKSRKLVKADRV